MTYQISICDDDSAHCSYLSQLVTRWAEANGHQLRLTDGTVLPLPRGAYEGINRAIIGMECL